MLLSKIDNEVQLQLRNLTESPLSQSTRVSSYNRVIDFLQSKSNWNCTKKRAFFEYLSGEAEYSVANNVGITDYKAYQDLKVVNSNSAIHYKEYEEIEANDFSVLESTNVYDNKINFEDREGDLTMRVLSTYSNDITTIDSMDDLTTGRTWASDTTGSDATTLTKDTNRGKSGNSLRFNIDVSQSVNNYAQIYTSVGYTSTIDASNIEGYGHFRFDMGLHNLSATNIALISSVTLIWGSDTTSTPSTKANYWSRTVTSPATGGDFQKSWNRMSFDWANATKTGSPDSSALDYFEIKVTYTSGMTDSVNVRVDKIDMYDPLEMELTYFSKNFVSKSGTWQEHFTTTTIATTETLLLPDRFFNLFVNLSLKYLTPQVHQSSDDYVRAVSEARTDLALAIQQEGNPLTREKNIFDLEGNSNGRVSSNMW